jgi:hypothetical protein
VTSQKALETTPRGKETPRPRKTVIQRLPKEFEKTIIELELNLEKGLVSQELIAMILGLYSVRNSSVNRIDWC